MKEATSKDIILVVATGWGAKHGGINSFNKDFCFGLGKILISNPRYRVICIVDTCLQDDIYIAHDNYITLYSLDKNKNGFFEAEECVSIRLLLEKNKVIVSQIKHVILHDITTGSLINVKHEFPEAKWSIIHHMHYNEYMDFRECFKSNLKLQNDRLQYEIFSKSDYKFAVGPLLKKCLEKLLTEHGSSCKVVELIPGMKEIQRPITSRETIRGLTFGRFNNGNDNLKLATLAIRAWNQACTIAHDKELKIKISKLKVVGFDFSNEMDKAKCKRLFTYNSDTVEPYEYINDDKLLNYILESTSLVLMLSRHEGFGLAGLEAIGAGIPLILTKNSGLWEYLKNHKLGDLTNYIQTIHLNKHFVKTDEKKEAFQEKELIAVTNCILRYFENSDYWYKNAQALRDKLRCKTTWENTAKTFLDAVEISENECTSFSQPVSKLEGTTAEQRDDEPDELFLNDFAKECVTKYHTLIFSHRTKIIDINSEDPFNHFRQFLDKFVDYRLSILNANSGLKKTLMIFVIDFGGESETSFDEQAFNNYVSLQSAFKAIFLVPSTYIKRKLTGDLTEDQINSVAYPGVSIKHKYRNYAANNYLLRALKNRVVVLGKNYEAFINNSKEMNDYCLKLLKDKGYVRLIEDGIIKKTNEGAETHLKLDPNSILMEARPPLDYITDAHLKKIIETNSTNFDKASDKSFGLYATVRFSDFNTGKKEIVQCYVINKGSEKGSETCNKLPLDKKSHCHGKATMFKDNIDKGMSIVSLSASYFLANEYWIKDPSLLVEYWPDYSEKNNIFKDAFFEVENSGFHHFTLSQFLNLPIIFPDDI